MYTIKYLYYLFSVTSVISMVKKQKILSKYTKHFFFYHQMIRTNKYLLHLYIERYMNDALPNKNSY